MAKKNPNSLGIHRRKNLLRVCGALGMAEGPMHSNREIINALAVARGIKIGHGHMQNADAVLAWFAANEPGALAKPIKKTKKPTRLQAVTAKSDFYLSWEWRTVRMEVLKEQGFACQCCGATARDRTTAGASVRLCVDHIRPISKFWELRLDKTNLQVLCDECNQGKGAWDETDHRVSSLIQ